MAKVKPLAHIDKNKLDYHWCVQAKKLRRYARMHALAEYDLNVEESRYDVVKAEVSKDIRDRPQRYGIRRVTEGAIDIALTLDKRVQKARRKVNKAKLRLAHAKAGVRTMEHVKTALENLVVLQGRDYWAEPRDRSVRREADHFHKRNRKGL
jgi:hypothetical protein